MVVNIDFLGALYLFKCQYRSKVIKKKSPFMILELPTRYYKDLKGELFHIDVCFEAYDEDISTDWVSINMVVWTKKVV